VSYEIGERNMNVDCERERERERERKRETKEKKRKRDKSETGKVIIHYRRMCQSRRMRQSYQNGAFTNVHKK